MEMCQRDDSTTGSVRSVGFLRLDDEDDSDLSVMHKEECGEVVDGKRRERVYCSSGDAQHEERGDKFMSDCAAPGTDLGRPLTPSLFPWQAEVDCPTPVSQLFCPSTSTSAVLRVTAVTGMTRHPPRHLNNNKNIDSVPVTSNQSLVAPSNVWPCRPASIFGRAPSSASCKRLRSGATPIRTASSLRPWRWVLGGNGPGSSEAWGCGRVGGVPAGSAWYALRPLALARPRCAALTKPAARRTRVACVLTPVRHLRVALHTPRRQGHGLRRR